MQLVVCVIGPFALLVLGLEFQLHRVSSGRSHMPLCVFALLILALDAALCLYVVNSCTGCRFVSFTLLILALDAALCLYVVNSCTGCRFVSLRC